ERRRGTRPKPGEDVHRLGESSATASPVGRPSRRGPPDASRPDLCGRLGHRLLATLAAWQAGRLERMRSPRPVLAHVWEGVELCMALPACYAACVSARGAWTTRGQLPASGDHR